MTEAVEKIINKIIEEQAAIIGPVAWSEAKKVHGLNFNPQTHEVSVEGNAKDVLENLVGQYEKLFGKLSREVCRDAVRPLIQFASDEEIPQVLK